MNEILVALIYGTCVGLTIPLGGYLSRIESIQPRWLEEEVRHSVIAFGGGILIAAVALVLVPEGMELLPPWASIPAFFAGGIFFAVIERIQIRHGGSHEQLLAMLADFVPESLALGALLATGGSEALLLAILIGVQNLPEAFNAWREIKAEGKLGDRRTMRLFFALAMAGPIAVVLGAVALVDAPAVTGVIMMAASGGILYLMFQAIAVKAHLENRQAPALAAVGGFAVGILCQALVG